MPKVKDHLVFSTDMLVDLYAHCLASHGAFIIDFCEKELDKLVFIPTTRLAMLNA